MIGHVMLVKEIRSFILKK